MTNAEIADRLDLIADSVRRLHPETFDIRRSNTCALQVFPDLFPEEWDMTWCLVELPGRFNYSLEAIAAFLGITEEEADNLFLIHRIIDESSIYDPQERAEVISSLASDYRTR